MFHQPIIHRTQAIDKNDSYPKVVDLATFFMLKRYLHSIVFLDYKQFKSRAKQEANIIMNLNILESQGAGGGGFSL
jgi:hypothetical protein